MPKSNPTAALAGRLIQALTACRAEGGDRYPVRLSDLAARLDAPADGPAVLKALGKKAIVAVKGRSDAPVALAEDAAALAASPLTLEAALRAKGEKGAPPWTPKQLAGALPEPLKAAFQGHCDRQLEAGEIPAFAGRAVKGKSVGLYHLDQPPPPPPVKPPKPEVRDAERLLDLLRRWDRPGGAVPLVSATELEQVAGLEPTTFKKAVKQPAFAAAVTPVKVKPNDVYLVLNADEFERFATGPLLARLLAGCERTDARAFPAKELIALLSDKAQKQTVAGLLNRPDLAGELPPGVGCVRLSGGQNAFFRLEHLQTARPATPVAIPTPAAAPADFATAFDAAFERLNRERGSNNFVSLVDLRAALAHVGRAAFDAGLQQLRRDRRYVLASDERYDGITAEQQAAAIREEGEFLLHVSRSRQ